MTEVETKVFESQTLGRRILRKKVLGRVPALPLAVMLIAAGFAAAALYALGPAASQMVQLRQMDSAGLPSGDILYGAKVNQVPVFFNITISSNTYTQAYTTHVVLTVVAAGAGGPFAVLADCGNNMVVSESTSPPGTYNAITATFAGGVCTYSGTVNQNVPAGSTTQMWPFKVVYQSAGTAGPQLTWTSQFWTNA